MSRCPIGTESQLLPRGRRVAGLGRTGLLARGSSSPGPFPPCGQWSRPGSFPLTAAGQRGIRTPFPRPSRFCASSRDGRYASSLETHDGVDADAPRNGVLRRRHERGWLGSIMKWRRPRAPDRPPRAACAAYWRDNPRVARHPANSRPSAPPRVPQAHTGGIGPRQASDPRGRPGLAVRPGRE
jgi:hypothetical protein